MKVIWDLLDIYGGRNVCKAETGVHQKIVVIYLKTDENPDAEDLYTLVYDFGASNYVPMSREQLVELLNNEDYQPVNEGRS